MAEAATIPRTPIGATRARRSRGRAPAGGRPRLRTSALRGGRRLRVDAGFLALLRRDRRGCRRQRVVAAAGLRERDDVAQRVRLREQHDDAVPAERDAAVRRRAELERVEQEAELLLRFLFAEAHQAEDALLDVAAVDTDRAAADLVAVADDVVGVGQRVARVLLELVDRLRGRPG